MQQELIYAVGKIKNRFYIIKANMMKVPMGGYTIMPKEIFYPPKLSRYHVEGAKLNIEFVSIDSTFDEAQNKYYMCIGEVMPRWVEGDYLDNETKELRGLDFLMED